MRWLDAQIRAQRYPNAERMAAELGISRRQAFADCAHLRREMEAPVASDAEKGGWYYTEPDYVALPLLYLSEEEAVALRRALAVSAAHLSPTETEPLHRLTERLAVHTPALRTTGRESVGGASPHPAPSAVASPQLLSDVDRAVHRRYRLRLLYWGQHRGAETDRVVRPYHLHLDDGGDRYLIAHCEWRNELRTFLLGRVREWTVLEPDYAFARPGDFDGPTLIRQGFHLQHGGGELEEVQIRFSPRQARWIRERVYHPTQAIDELPDGGLVLSLRVTGLEEVRRWVLGYGREAEVLTPLSLREAVHAEGVALVAVYAVPSLD